MRQPRRLSLLATLVVVLALIAVHAGGSKASAAQAATRCHAAGLTAYRRWHVPCTEARRVLLHGRQQGLAWKLGTHRGNWYCTADSRGRGTCRFLQQTHVLARFRFH